MKILIIGLLALSSNLSYAEESLYDLVNKARNTGVMCGSKKMAKTTKLEPNQKLWEASANHAADMKNKDYFSHKDPNGVGPETRLINVGYLKECKMQAYAENIAAGPSSEKEIFDTWMASEDHCTNIMNPKVKEMGYFHTIGFPKERKNTAHTQL